MSKALELDAITLGYGNTTVVEALSLRLEQGAIGCLLGPSGCGKTTVLRAVAGFEPVRAGAIRLAGHCLAAPGANVPPEQRGIGMVFQDFALFPHLDLRSNIAFGLRRLGRRARRQRVDELLELIGLAGAGNQYPHQLSGGMQQRVAIARALAPRPRLLLLDEPFSSMDAELREQLAGEVRELLRRQEMTAIMVTHDQQEAFAMADRIGVIHQGRIRQWDTAQALYQTPADRFVAGFIGQGSLLPARVRTDYRLDTPLGVLDGNALSCSPSELAPGARVELLLRPQDVVLDPASPSQATLLARVFRGAYDLYTLQLPDGSTITATASTPLPQRPGECIGVRAAAKTLVGFPVQATKQPT